MARVCIATLPSDALLANYTQSGAYTDCYSTTLDAEVSFGHYVHAFYTTPLFKVERMLLGLFARRPSTDREAQALANGNVATFSAWSVEARERNQLLLRDMTGRTRSWLMIEPQPGPGANQTRLYFGSAVLPRSINTDGKPSFGIAFNALFGFHRLYSRALLSSAGSRLVIANAGDL